MLSGLFASRTVLFAGLDAKSLAATLELAGIRSATGQRHYALVTDGPGFELSANRLLRHYGIEFIRIAAGDSPGAFLNRLARRVAAVRRGGDQPRETEEAEQDRAAITHLSLRDIGPFQTLEVEFKERWTILLGNNGAGKSTILRAVALALCGDDALVSEPGRPLLRRGALGGQIELTVATGRSEVRYRSTLSMVQGRLAISAARAPLQSGIVTAFGFPAVRGVMSPGLIEVGRDEAFPHPRVADVLPIIAGGMDDRGRSLKQWILRAYMRSLDPHLPDVDRQRSRAMIDSLFRLLDSMTPGFDLRFSRCDPTPPRYSSTHPTAKFRWTTSVKG